MQIPMQHWEGQEPKAPPALLQRRMTNTASSEKARRCFKHIKQVQSKPGWVCGWAAMFGLLLALVNKRTGWAGVQRSSSRVLVSPMQKVLLDRPCRSDSFLLTAWGGGFRSKWGDFAEAKAGSCYRLIQDKSMSYRLTFKEKWKGLSLFRGWQLPDSELKTPLEQLKPLRSQWTKGKNLGVNT